MNKIFDILKKQKSIPLDKYIDVALYDNKFGYYIKKNPFAKKGDYKKNRFGDNPLEKES